MLREATLVFYEENTMGHYDAQYDRDYDDEMARRSRARQEKIPEIIDALEEARRYLARATGSVDRASRMEDALQDMIYILKGQLKD
jgi:hypothetical protein